MCDSIIIYKGFQFKLEPTAAQEGQFWQYCGATRWVYNHMLGERKQAYQATGKSPSALEQKRQLPLLKRQPNTAWLNTIHSQVLQEAVLDLEDAFERFFRKESGYPHFKKKHGRKQSFSYPQGVKVTGAQVFLPKIGWVRFRQSREVVGRVKRATVKHKASGWYISLLCEVEIPDAKPVPITDQNSIGIDLGSIDLVTTSRSAKIANKRHYRTTERKLKSAQRSLSRKQKGSNRYSKQQRTVARLHERAADRRKDDLHKLSRQLVDESQAIFCEDLNVKGIARRMGKSVGDAGWSELVRQLKYKAKWAGKTLLQISRYYPSTRTCAYCDYVHADLELSERYWKCPSCGTWLDRDVNAAVNIHREGLKLAWGRQSCLQSGEARPPEHLAAGPTERLNARGQTVRPARRARLGEARISRL